MDSERFDQLLLLGGFTSSCLTQSSHETELARCPLLDLLKPRSRWFFRFSPTQQGTPISVRPVGNFGEATQMMTLLFHIADPFQDSYTFDPKLDEEEMERHNGPTK